MYVSMVVLGLHCCTHAFSSCGQWGLLCSYSAWASHCGGFSCRGAQALGCMGFSSFSVVAADWLQSTGSVVVLHGPSCPVPCGIFPDQGLNLCSLNWQVDSKPLDHQRSPLIFISVLFSCSVMSHSLQLQHARLPGACSNSCPSSR